MVRLKILKHLIFLTITFYLVDVKTIEYYIDDFIIWCEAERGYSQNTIKSYKSDLKKLQAYFKNDITKIDEKSFLKFLKQQFENNLISSRSQARFLTTLKTFFVFLQTNNTLDNKVNSFDFINFIDSPKVKQSLPKAIDYSQIEKLLNAFLPLDEFSARNSTILEVMYSCGLRISEVVG